MGLQALARRSQVDQVRIQVSPLPTSEIHQDLHPLEVRSKDRFATDGDPLTLFTDY